MSMEYRRNIIVVGKTGNGKSFLSNVLLRMSTFLVACSFNGVTKTSKVKTKDNLSVVDTPGLFDSDGERNLVMQALEVQKAIKLCPNPHAFLIVLNGSTRLTQDELSTIAVLRIIFGEQCLKRAIIVLTHIENNVDEKQLKERIDESSEMSDLIKQCGNRFARIDNRYPKAEHIKHVISLVDQVSQRGRHSFKNEFLHVHEQVLQEAIKIHDSAAVHVQTKRLSEQILKAVEEEKFNRKCWEVAVGFSAVCVFAGIVYFGGGCTTVATTVRDVETAQVSIQTSVNVATGLIRSVSSAH